MTPETVVNIWLNANRRHNPLAARLRASADGYFKTAKADLAAPLVRLYDETDQNELAFPILARWLENHASHPRFGDVLRVLFAKPFGKNIIHKWAAQCLQTRWRGQIQPLFAMLRQFPENAPIIGQTQSWVAAHIKTPDAGAALSLLRDAYQRRDKVAVVTFRGDDARVLLPPTTSAYIASRRLTRFDTGGTTPLAKGLLAARDLVVRERVRDRTRRALVVVLTDGRATGGPDPLGRSRSAAQLLVAEGAAAVVVDCETSYVRLGLAGELAQQLKAPVLRLEQLRADYLARAVRSAA